MKDIRPDVVRVIDEFLREDIHLKDAEKWINKHPCLARKPCSKENMRILSKFKKLTSRLVNENEWQDFRDELKDSLSEEEI